MGPGVGQQLQLELESVSRLASSCKPRRCSGLGTLGTAAAVGAAAATPTAVGASGSSDVESHCQCLGFLEQRNMDFDLTKRRFSPARGDPSPR
jgi:hypothetical protein